MNEQISDQPLIEFHPKLPKLSKNESQVLKLLVEAGKLIVPVYLEQEKQLSQQISKEEIEKAAKKDSQIRSPYTVIERQGGKLIAIPYHDKFANLLKPVANKLVKAASITENKEFAKFLSVQAKALVTGNYEEAIITGLKMEPYIIDVSIGPNDLFDDQLFFAKASYQCWVGIVEVEGTERFNNYKSVVFGTARKVLVPAERINNYNQVKAKVIDVMLYSGLLAKTKFVGINLPFDLNIVEKYGSEITLFNQPNDLRVKEQIIPVFDKIFPKAFREEYSLEDLRRGYLRAVALHELAHSYLRYRNAANRLQDLFPLIDELAATILGLRMAGSLLLKDRITEKQLESMIVAFLCRSFYHITTIKANRPLISYSLGGTIFINFMLKNGALKWSATMIAPNFMKIFVALHELFSILEDLLSRGSRQDAEIFIKEYGQQPSLAKKCFFKVNFAK